MTDANSPPCQYGNWERNNERVVIVQPVHHTRRLIESGESVADFQSGKLLKIAAAPSAVNAEYPKNS